MRAHRIVAWLAVVIALLAPTTLTACSSAQGSGEHVQVAAFAADAAKPGTTLIDVRTPGEFAAGHIAGARNVDVEGPDFAQQIGTLDKNAHYAVYCRSGHRSRIALDKMRQAGFGDMTGLEGGISAWVSAGKPLTG